MNFFFQTFRPRLLILLLLFASYYSRPCYGDDAATYEQVLSAHPTDVDTRLQYALYLSRAGKLDQAKRQAAKVIQQAPEYWDAHLLLSRIAGWEHRFEIALFYVNKVLDNAPDYPGAIQLKLDLLKWMQDHESTEILLQRLLRSGVGTADIYYRLAEVERARLQYLLAYRHAQSALDQDPNHQGAKDIVNNTRRVTFQMNQELEYFGFNGEEARPDRLGMGLTVSGTAFQNAKFSATITDIVRYRFRTLNNQIGLQASYRPFRYIGFTLKGQLGKPAHVVPRGTILASVRGELFKIMDGALSFVTSFLSWPKNDQAILLRPSIALGFFLHKQFRLGASYTLGMLRYCRLSPVITHSGQGSVSWLGKRIQINLSAGFSEERDPVEFGIIPPKNCEEIVTLQKTAPFAGERFKLVDIRTVHTGFNLSYPFNRTATLQGAYRLELKKANTNNDTIPAHITSFGLSVWF